MDINSILLSILAEMKKMTETNTMLLGVIMEQKKVIQHQKEMLKEITSEQKAHMLLTQAINNRQIVYDLSLR